MKKKIFALAGIVIIATIAIFSSCNKETNMIGRGEIGNEEVQSKDKTITHQEYPFYPHFRWTNSMTPTFMAHCNAPSGDFCGFYIDDVLNGDEACWLMMYDNAPYRLYLPTKVILANNADVLIDSARTGSMSYHSDFAVKSTELMKLTDVDLIPAGRYPTFMTTHNGDSAVCICLDTVI